MPTPFVSDIAFFGLDLVGATAIVYGVLNLSATELRPHHRDFLGWPIPSVVVRFILKALKIIGLLLVAYGVTIISLTSIPLRRAEMWAWVLLGVLNLGVLPPLTWIIYSIGRRGPWWLSASALVIFLCCWIPLVPAPAGK